ncbi:MAG: hypothetical protein ACK42Y_06240 [Candidatus Thermochlorobacter sp.]
MERWNAVKDELFYVLVRIKQSDIRSPFLVSQSNQQDSLRMFLRKTTSAPKRTLPELRKGKN